MAKTCRPACGNAVVRGWGLEMVASSGSSYNDLGLLQDDVIGRELEASGQVGGCTALVAVALQGKLYVANAGDSR